MLPLEDSLLNKSSNDSVLSHKNKIIQTSTISHEGDINIAKIMPQKENILATKGSSGLVYVFDTEKTEENNSKVQLTLTGHSKEGLSLA